MYKLYDSLTYPYQLPPLRYEYASLEPHIDARTMEIHHTKHHDTYVTKLNGALKEHEELHAKTLTELLNDIEKVSDEVRQAVINHGGGHANHTLFWHILTPGGSSEPTGELADQINASFESLAGFKENFTETATNRFGSGWAWLVLNQSRNLEIIDTPNQDSPLLTGRLPILGIDVWEHAYYLKYQNRRPEYIESWWRVVNWDVVEKLYREVKYQTIETTT